MFTVYDMAQYPNSTLIWADANGGLSSAPPKKKENKRAEKGRKRPKKADFQEGRQDIS